MPPKHVPLRTCIACRTARAKYLLIRIVRTPEGDVVADATGRRNGRGAYVDADAACLERGLGGGSLAHALETEVTDAQRERLYLDIAAIASERAQRVSAPTPTRPATTAIRDRAVQGDASRARALGEVR